MGSGMWESGSGMGDRGWGMGGWRSGIGVGDRGWRIGDWGSGIGGNPTDGSGIGARASELSRAEQNSVE